MRQAEHKEPTMSMRGRFRVIPGFRDDSAQSAPAEPASVHLIGTTTIHTLAEQPTIGILLRNKNPYMEYLAGKTVGVLSEEKIRGARGVFREKHYKIRVGVRFDQSSRRIYIPVEWCSVFTPPALTGLLNPSQQQEALLRQCLLADRIFDLHQAIVRRPKATRAGLDREAVLHLLASRHGNNLCEVCEQEIERSTFWDEECQFYGPARQRCFTCKED